MMRSFRVLVVDDDEEWRSLLTEIFPSPEFRVETAASAQHARAALRSTFYHLLTLDIRLQDADEANVEGFELLRELAKNGQNEAMKVIVLSHFGTDEQQREAFKDYDVMDFVRKARKGGKGFDNREFLGNVRDAVAREYQLNLALNVYWQEITGPQEAVQGLQVQGTRLRPSDRDSEFARRLAEELDDLLCRLFHDAQDVLIHSMPRGQGGGGLLLAEPQYAERGGGQPVVVKYGDVTSIHQEAENYRTFVSGFVGGHRAAQLTRERRTALLAGITYSLLGQASSRFRDFEAFYDEASTAQVTKFLEALFNQVCGNWYANVKAPELLNLTEDYQKLLGFSLDSLETALAKGLPSVQGKERLKFESLNSDRRFANPLQQLARQPIILRTCRGVTHGDLNHSNVLLDSQNNAWLIDYQNTGWGHFLRDFARLDAIVRFRLLKGASLDERLVMEEALGSVSRYSELTTLESAFEWKNPEVEKAFQISVAIRKLASGVATRGNRDEFREYHAASFYFAINWLRFYGTASRLEREHALIAAAVLAANLS